MRQLSFPRVNRINENEIGNQNLINAYQNFTSNEKRFGLSSSLKNKNIYKEMFL